MIVYPPICRFHDSPESFVMCGVCTPIFSYFPYFYVYIVNQSSVVFTKKRLHVLFLSNTMFFLTYISKIVSIYIFRSKYFWEDLFFDPDHFSKMSSKNIKTRRFLAILGIKKMTKFLFGTKVLLYHIHTPTRFV